MFPRSRKKLTVGSLPFELVLFILFIEGVCERETLTHWWQHRDKREAVLSLSDHLS